MITWGHILKTLYLHYRNPYGHKTYQGGDILQGVPTHKIAWPFSDVFLWGDMKNWMHYIFILLSDPSTFKATLPFHFMTKMRSRGNLKKLYLIFIRLTVTKLEWVLHSLPPTYLLTIYVHTIIWWYCIPKPHIPQRIY